jgi:serine/threonine-protein kinase
VGGFRILRRLASGAASDVLLARAEGPHGFQRVVALKILLAKAKADPDFERHFAAEASAYARLSHPAVVKLYDFFAADGQLVMVLEFVDGLPLHKLRAMLAIAGERIEDPGALFLGLRIFSALAAAHGARDPATGEFAPITHADVNPSNILVPWDGHVKLGDFGIARAAGLQSDPRSGFIKGTYGYIAPEQVAGKEPTVRADVYSAGLIVWELLARRKAVQRGSLSDAQVLKAMAHPEFPTLELLRPDLDASIREAIRRALEPDPDKRSITAEEMVNVLRQGVSADEGRKSLADALMRVRSTGAADPLASTTQGPANVDGDGPMTPPPSSRRSDMEDTAQFQAATDEQGDLGKIAFYGRLNLPTGSEPPRPLGARGKSQPPPLPVEATTVVNVPSPVAGVPIVAPSEVTMVVNMPVPAAAGGPSPPDVKTGLDVRSPAGHLPATGDARVAEGADAPAPRRPPSPSPSRGRLVVPRPVSVSNLQTVRAPPLVVEEDDGARLVAAGAPPPAKLAIGGMPTTPGFSPVSPHEPPAPSPAPAPVTTPPAVLATAAAVPAAPKNIAMVTPFVLAAPVALAVSASSAEPEPAAPAPVDPPSPEAPHPEAPGPEAPREGAPHASPSTERSPRSTPPPMPPADTAQDSAAEEVAAAPPPVVGSVRPNEPPYALSALPEPHKSSSRGSAWLIAAGIGVLLAGGGVFFLFRGDLLPETPVADSTPSAVPVASASPAPSPEPVASAPSAPAAPSASASAVASAEPAAPPPSASASSEPVASAAPSASASSPPAASSVAAAASAPPASSATTPTASAAAATPPAAEPADSGQLDLPASAEGHRIFVDDKVAGEGTAPIHVHCGAHVIRIGSAGKERKVDVPCGGSLQL